LFWLELSSHPAVQVYVKRSTPDRKCLYLTGKESGMHLSACNIYIYIHIHNYTHRYKATMDTRIQKRDATHSKYIKNEQKNNSSAG